MQLPVKPQHPEVVSSWVNKGPVLPLSVVAGTLTPIMARNTPAFTSFFIPISLCENGLIALELSQAR